MALGQSGCSLVEFAAYPVVNIYPQRPGASHSLASILVAADFPGTNIPSEGRLTGTL
jgi:hypothetical protein